MADSPGLAALPARVHASGENFPASGGATCVDHCDVIDDCLPFPAATFSTAIRAVETIANS